MFEDLPASHLLYLLASGQITTHQMGQLSDDQLLWMELEILDAIAIKRAGGEMLVHWAASEELH